MSKKTDYWTEYEKQVAEWFASGDCNYAHKAMEKAKDQQKLWKSQTKYEIVGNKWDPWNQAGVPWETWNNMFMEDMDPEKRNKLIEKINESRADDPDWKFYKNRLNTL